MNTTNLYRKPQQEIMQMTEHDSFLVFDRVKEVFDFPIHYHPEIELNYISNGKGLRRVVGDSLEEIGDKELVLVGPNLYHCWEQHNAPRQKMHEITIQFSNELFQEELLNRAILKPIKDMFAKAKHGIVFSKEILLSLEPKICMLSKMEGIDYFLQIVSILYDLSISRNQRILSYSTVEPENFKHNQKLNTLSNYIKNNFSSKITIDDVCQLLNMSNQSFSRFVKKSTGKTFVDYLNDFRIGYASRLLIERDESISEIAYACGFNSIANFNRRFKKNKGCTPTDYRNEFLGIRKIL